MYKPVQKKNSSWTPSTVQNKGKSPSKLGHFSIQPKPKSTSTPPQEIGEYSRDSADRLTANVMRSLQTREQELAEESTLQPKFESPWAPTFEPPPPLPESPASKLKGAFAPVSENPIQRQCAECAKEEEEQKGEEKKDLDEIGIQTKLTIGAPGDTYEQEADRVETRHGASLQVMSMSAPADSSASVQRQLDTNHPHHPHQIWQRAQSIQPVVQRQIDPRVQMRQMIQRAAQIDGNQASGDLESRLNASKGGGSPLSEDVRGFMEPRFGADFSGVRVHTGGEAVQMNQELGAQAFTHGSDVYFGAGKEPGNNELTAHELTHVVQQMGVVHTKLNFDRVESLVQRLTAEEKELNLKSPRFAENPRMEAVYDNSPAMRQGEHGDAVKLVQQALIDDGFEMPISTRKTGEPDGIFGNETYKIVWQFQEKHQLGKDGVVGRNTLGKLDELSPNSATNPEQQTGDIQTQPSAPDKIWYMLSVPPVVQQPGYTCWAAALSSWLSAMKLDSKTVRDIVWRYTGSACIDSQDNSLHYKTAEEVFAEWGVHFTKYSTHGSVTYNELKSLLKRHGHLIMAETGNAMGHARVVYGVGIDDKKQPNPNYFSVMDPLDAQYKNVPFSGLIYPVEIGFFGKRERPAPCLSKVPDN
jgi:hypothetical protein